MNPLPQKPARSFFWQGVLILLPVAVLAGVGLFSLKQDRATARQEAAVRAQELADGLLRDIWRELTPPPKKRDDSEEVPWFFLNPPGQLASPPPYAPIPAPCPVDTKEDPGSPSRLAVLNRYRLGLELERAGDLPGAKEAFRALERDVFDPLRTGSQPGRADILTESGLPLEPLVRLKRFELETDHANASREQYEIICREFVDHPSALTPRLLQRIAALAPARATNDIRRWQKKWDLDEIARGLYAAALAAHPALPSAISSKRSFPQVMTLHLPSDATNAIWLVIGENEAQEEFYYCHTLASAARRAMDVIQKTVIPDYLGASVEAAGKSVIPDSNAPVWYETGGGSKGGGIRRSTLDPGTFHSSVIATAQSAKAGGSQLTVKIHLTNEQAMYASHDARALRFGLLIAGAALVALVGFVSAHRAFHRQQHLNEMKDNFVSSVSHELRAPIASVRLMAENLEQGRVADAVRQAEYYRFIGQECRRLSSLIENVLDFSRIEQGRKQYEFEPTEVVALVRQTVKLMEPVATQTQIKLITTLDEAALGQLPSPQLDGQAMQQALINLVDNAIKHSPSHATVEVRLEIAAGRLRFTVADQGEGIPAEDHARIFERFYRRGSELRRETQGIGIGLSIVKHIVDAHGGAITVDSAPGRGSRFTIDLPLSST